MAESYAVSLATFTSRETTETELSCLIKKYENRKTPLPGDVVLQMKTLFKYTYNQEYNSGSAHCPSTKLTSTAILQAPANGDKTRDNALQASRHAHDVMGPERTKIEALISDVVARNGATIMQQLVSLRENIVTVFEQDGAAQ